LLYERCRAHNIPFKQTGKLVVARHDQRPYIEKLHTKSLSLRWPFHSLETPQTEHVLPTQLLSGRQAREMEPDLSDEIVAALWCPLTGIIDSHALMESLELNISESEGGELVLATDVVRVDPYRRLSQGSNLDVEEGWVVQATDSSNNDERYAVLARTVINASGLSGALVLNSILSKDKQIPMYYARGSYASYHGPGVSRVTHLIYPCPETGPNAHAFESLGTHLTLDLQGRIRFGPDIEWMSPPASVGNESEDDGDFWMHNLIPDDSRLQDMQDAITTYLPDVQSHGLQPDYVGIRPKLIPPGGGFQDFVLRVDYPGADAERNRHSPMVSLLGIESPGLTSSLAIAEIVVEHIVGEHIRFN
jgi:2-hydroxyglutarate dehydrogenase